MSSSRGTVLVLGGGGGIGRACVDLLTAHGYRVLVAGRSVGSLGGSVEALSVDFRADDAAEEVFEWVCQATARHRSETGTGQGPSNRSTSAELPELVGLVHCAGTVGWGPFEAASESSLRELVESNLLAPLELTRAMLPALREARGHVVFCGSMSAGLRLPYLSPYSACAAAVEAAGESLSAEVEPLGVHVTTLRIGRVRSGLWAKAAIAVEELRVPPAYADAVGAVAGRVCREGGESPARVAEAVLASLLSACSRFRVPVCAGSVFDRVPALLPPVWRNMLYRRRIRRLKTTRGQL